MPFALSHAVDAPTTLDAASATHRGRRERNEDATLEDPAHRLFAVADGMGGHVGGAVASGLVVETLRGFFERGEAGGPTLIPGYGGEPSAGERRMDMAIRLTQRAVTAAAKGQLEEMGSTLVALHVGGNAALVAHVGDSRAYRLRGGELSQLTEDHSLLAALRAQGSEKLADSLPARYQGMVTRSLGPLGDSLADLRVVDVEAGDVFLLCSDGLSGVLEPEDLASLMRQPSAADASRSLVDAAYAAGGLDNITAIVVRVGAAPADPAHDGAARHA